MPPPGDAVRLIDTDHGNPGSSRAAEGCRKGQKVRTLQPLGRDVEQLQAARKRRFIYIPALSGRGTGGKHGGRDSAAAQYVRLILHQGNQGRDDDREAGKDEGRQLAAQGFAGAGREDAQDVPPLQNFIDDGFLTRPERGMSEVLPEQAVFEIIFFHEQALSVW